MDHGYAVIGTTRNYGIYGISNARLMQFDAFGDTLWTRTFSDSAWGYGISLLQNPDSGFCIARNVDTTYPFHETHLIRTDKSGNTLWEKVMRGDAVALKSLSNGGYLLTGSLFDTSVNASSGYLIKTNNFGDTVWTRSLSSGLQYTWFSETEVTGGGNLVTVGYTHNNIDFGSLILASFDSSGNVLWTKTYPDCRGFSIEKTLDGGFVIAGQANDTGIVVYRTNSIGDTLWTRNYGGKYGRSIVALPDGSFALTGAKIRDPHAPFPYFFEDIVFLKTDSLGNALLQRSYGDTLDDGGVKIIQSSDGSFVIAGYADWVLNIGIGPLTGGTFQGMLMKIDSLGIISGIEKLEASHSSLYPNPAADYLFVKGPFGKNCGFSVISLDGSF
jgi:hypothetical protein